MNYRKVVFKGLINSATLDSQETIFHNILRSRIADWI